MDLYNYRLKQDRRQHDRGKPLEEQQKEVRQEFLDSITRFEDTVIRQLHRLGVYNP